MNPASPKDFQSGGLVADVQKVREAATTIQGARDGTNVANPDILFPVFAQ